MFRTTSEWGILMKDEGCCFDDGDGVISTLRWWGEGRQGFRIHPALIFDVEGQCRDALFCR